MSDLTTEPRTARSEMRQRIATLDSSIEHQRKIVADCEAEAEHAREFIADAERVRDEYAAILSSPVK